MIFTIIAEPDVGGCGVLGKVVYVPVKMGFAP
jgi:hypothetical protein